MKYSRPASPATPIRERFRQFVRWLNKIRNKLMLAMLMVFMIPAGLIGGYGLYYSSGALEKSAEIQLREKLDSLATGIEHFLDGVYSDLFFLRDSSSLSRFNMAVSSGDEAEIADARKALAKDFLSLSANREIYHQIRFLDVNGKELVRVDRIRGASKVVPDDKLQNKKGRYYFEATIALANGGVMISPLDLNREKGIIEKPYRPTIRYATPVYDEENNLQGMLILNVQASRFLDRINRGNAFGETQMLVDRKGFYLVHADSNKTWGGPTDLDTGENLLKDEPELAAKVVDSRVATIFEDSNHLIASVPLFADRERKVMLGTLIDKVPNTVVYQSVTQFKNVFVIIALTAFVVTGFVALLLAGSIANPIVYLTQATNNMSKGDLDTRIEVKSNDETQALAAAIERLRKSMKILMEKYS